MTTRVTRSGGRWTLIVLLAIGTASGCGALPGRSAPEVTIKPDQHGRTFGDVMRPMAAKPWPTADLAVSTGASPPLWGPLKRIRWDEPGTFTHSHVPHPLGSAAAATSKVPAQPDEGAEYAVLQSADVTFTITARRFAIVYRGNQNIDAMVWIDSRPIAAHPIFSEGPVGTATPNWISITLPERRTVDVRFAGPLTFTGLDVPEDEAAAITATRPRATLGVLSDSYYVMCPDTGCLSRNAAQSLATRTGFRVWNMSEPGTGYLNPGRPLIPGYEPSNFGSASRLRAVQQAPIDALLIGGSINDAMMPLTHYRATVDQLLNDIAKRRPGLPVVLLGIEPLPGEYEGKLWRKRGEFMTDVLRSMVRRHDNVVGFIDPFSTPWLSGSGSIAKPTGDGNDDEYIGTDGIHPSAAGMQFYQGHVARALRTIPFPAVAQQPATQP